jgi:hypothetical protein
MALTDEEVISIANASNLQLHIVRQGSMWAAIERGFRGGALSSDRLTEGRLFTPKDLQQAYITFTLLSENTNDACFNQPPRLDRLAPTFPCPNPNDLLYWHRKDLTIPDLAGACCMCYRFDNLIDLIVRNHDVNLKLRKEVYLILATAVDLSNPLLLAAAFYFCDCYGMTADIVERLLNDLELVRSNYSHYLLHVLPQHSFVSTHKKGQMWYADSSWSAGSKPTDSSSSLTRNPMVRSMTFPIINVTTNE